MSRMSCAQSTSCCRKHPKACLASSRARATQVPRDAYHEWVPRRRAAPTVCVVSVVTAQLLSGWGGYAVEQNANWALAHGYKYVLFTNILLPSGLPAVWSKPRAALSVLQQGERECAIVFFLDGDAVVHGVHRSLDEVISSFLPVGGPDLVMSCHSPFGRHGACHVGDSCRCDRSMAEHCPRRALEKMLERPIAGARVPPYCHINSGAYLARNSAPSLELMGWWALMKGCSSAAFGRGAPEQACAIRMKNQWPRLVDVVSARHFNTPAWFHTNYDSAADPVRVYEAARLRPNSSGGGCFDDPAAFVCHLWNAMRMSASRLLALREAAFARELNARRPQLHTLVEARGERYINVSALVSIVTARGAGGLAGGTGHRSRSGHPGRRRPTHGSSTHVITQPTN